MSEGFSPWTATIGVLTNPIPALQAVAEKPRVWPGYLVQSVVTLLAVAITLPKTMELTMQQLGSVPGPAVIGGVIAGIIGALASPWLIGLLVALVAKLIGSFYEREVPFRAYFSMLGYARIPTAIGSSLASLMVLSVGSFEATKQLSLSPAVFVPNGTPLVRAFLLTLNPFDLWTLALVAVGFAAIHRMQPARGASLSVALYLVGFVFSFIGLGIMGRM